MDETRLSRETCVFSSGKCSEEGVASRGRKNNVNASVTVNVGRCGRQRDAGQRWAGMCSVVVVHVEVGECDWHECN